MPNLQLMSPDPDAKLLVMARELDQQTRDAVEAYLEIVVQHLNAEWQERHIALLHRVEFLEKERLLPIQVQVPEGAIQLQMPLRKTITEKTIQYSPQGLPVSILERSKEE